MKEQLVVVGNGMAAGRAIERLLEIAPDRYEISIFNAEPRVNYDRIMLSPVLSGEKSFEDIVIHDDDWYRRNSIALHKHARVVRIDRDRRIVSTAAGLTAAYDKLILATGSAPIIIPVPGHQLAGVTAYRDFDDVQAMISAARAGGRAVVIGGGLLGIEAAAGLKTQGMDVTVLHLAPYLMERQLDPVAAAMLRRSIEERGIRIITDANTKAILGRDSVEAVRLDDGTELPADLVVMAVGIRPNVDLAKSSGLETGRGVVVDSTLQTSDPAISAIGECVEFEGQTFGLVAPLYEMAGVLARRLAGDRSCAYLPTPTATKLKVTGINLFSAGSFAETQDQEDIILRDRTNGVYKRLVLRNGKVAGAVLFGETSGSAWFFDLICKQTDIGRYRDTLMFGPSFAEACAADTIVGSAPLPDEVSISCGDDPAGSAFQAPLAAGSDEAWNAVLAGPAQSGAGVSAIAAKSFTRMAQSRI